MTRRRRAKIIRLYDWLRCPCGKLIRRGLDELMHHALEECPGWQTMRKADNG